MKITEYNLKEGETVREDYIAEIYNHGLFYASSYPSIIKRIQNEQVRTYKWYEDLFKRALATNPKWKYIDTVSGKEMNLVDIASRLRFEFSQYNIYKRTSIVKIEKVSPHGI